MPIVTFDVPTAIATELNAIAVSKGYANAKAMTIAWLKQTLTIERQRAIDAAREEANADDATIT